MEEKKIVAGYVRTGCDKTNCVCDQVDPITRSILDEAPESRELVLYIDRGFSGDTTERPAYQSLMTDISAGKVEEVIVFEMSLLSSDAAAFEEIIHLARENNVIITSIT